MNKKKRHHYIPRFYLKRFSFNNEGKYLGLYNFDNDRFVPNAPLRHQAYKNHLYGEDDEIENALAEMECSVAKMFYYWTEEKLLYPPPIGSDGFKLLKRFVLLQTFRTPKSGNNLEQTLNQALKTIVSDLKQDKWESIKKCKLGYENPVLISLLNSIKYESYLDFLDCKFLVNLSPIPLITSDSPVIFYNQLLEKSGNYIGATGLTAKGLQVFYPIHPRLMICFYDSSVYEFGGSDNFCSTESSEEINQLNGLQLINSKSQLFFDNYITEEYINKLCVDFRRYRGKAKNINRIIYHDSRKFLFTSSLDIPIDLKLEFLKCKVNINDYRQHISPMRHPSFYQTDII